MQIQYLSLGLIMVLASHRLREDVILGGLMLAIDLVLANLGDVGELNEVAHDVSQQDHGVPIYGWYYLSESDRSASWSGVEFLYNFLVSNNSVGPFGKEVARRWQGTRLR